MKVVLFYHSLVSDWNNGNAHFLRGIAWELRSRGHQVGVWEPRDSWSMQNLIAEHGDEVVRAFHRAYPGLLTNRYDLETLDLDMVLDGADLVIAHEWNDPELIARLGKHRAAGASYRLLFHDTHHRSVTSPEEMRRFDLSHFDGVLAYGEAIRHVYLDNDWAANVWTWHEAADTRTFRPLRSERRDTDLVWIGNWGDDERSAEIRRYLVRPLEMLGLKGVVYGVRYPDDARRLLEEAGIDYRGWLPNHQAPRVFSTAKATIHVPRRPYVRMLPGIPTIRIFEALACGIPLVSAPWDDVEGLFRPGRDFLFARDGHEMKRHLRMLMHDTEAAAELAGNGLQTVTSRHTCAHRVDELLAIHDLLAAKPPGRNGLTAAERSRLAGASA